MARKPASMYRKTNKVAYTRRDYVTGIPASKIVRHIMGDVNKSPKDFPIKVTLRVDEECQLRHGSLEAARLTCNRHLVISMGENNYRLLINKFPHQILRENKVATGAGADRVSDGMRLAFGKPVGTAARVNRGDVIFTVYCSVDKVDAAKESLRRAYNKLSPPCRIVVDRGQELIK
jgi:large subunit ribosomal protein L10e